MSEVKHGIEETKQVLKLGFLLTTLISKELKDGAQFQDLASLFVAVQGNPANKAVLEAALKDVSKVPEEIKDIDFMEVAALIAFVAPEVVGLVNELKKA